MISQMKRTILICLVFLLGSLHSSSAAESDPEIQCGTEDAMRSWYARNPDSRREAEAFDASIKGFSLRKSAAAVSYVIPVVVHVFGTAFAGTTVTDAIITDALNKTNSDFKGLTADWNSVSSRFAPVKKAIDITFKLAKKDPNGNPTTGIVYYPETSGFGNGSGFDTRIRLYAWDNFKYMNLYIMLDLYADGDAYNSGVSWYPDTKMSESNLARTVFNGRYLGTNTDENFRRVLTHEFGHFFNLKHTFEGSCTMPNDGCDDTPPTTVNSSSCNVTVEKCSGYGIPNGENFMDYTKCYRMFTIDQVDRMVAALESHPARRPLWQPNNLIVTGVSTMPLTGIVADFTAAPGRIPTGRIVIFTSATQTETGTTITSAQWTFSGGTPSSYSGTTPPAITYASEGTFSVQLKAENSKGATSTKNKPACIIVKNAYCDPFFRFGTYSHITNVKFGTINHTTGENGVVDYTGSQTAAVIKGSDYSLSVTANVGNSQPGDGERVRVWIDWDKNWQFDPGELVMAKEFTVSSGNRTFTQSITVPGTAAQGKTAMRVLTNFKQGIEGDNPCDVMECGECEDYGINISGTTGLNLTGPLTAAGNLKQLAFTYSAGFLVFKSPLLAHTVFSLFTTSGRMLYTAKTSVETYRLQCRLPGAVLVWRAENPANPGLFGSGRVVLMR